MQRLNRALRLIPLWVVWLVAATPLILLSLDVWSQRVGIDPVRSIEHRLGRTAIYFLLGTLAVSPLRQWTGVNLMRFRRTLGLICFSYAAMHALSWVVFDMGMIWGQIVRDVTRRPYLLMGMGAGIILVVLAVTSNNFSIRRLGRGWRRIHLLAHAAAILASLHWLWALKLWGTWPLTIASVAGLLALRRVAGLAMAAARR